MHRLVGCVVLCLIILPTRPAPAADAVGMIVDLVGRDDADFRSIGLDRIRHAAKGGEATRRFASLLATLPPERQVELTKALADRGDAAAIPAITAMLKAARDPATRSAAVAALGVLGGGAEVAVLANSLAAADPEKSAARRALAAIRGDDAVNRLVDAATSGDRGLRPVFIEILAERRVRAALPVFVAASTDADPAVRGAAMRALGRLAGPDQVPGMVQGYLKAAGGSERTEAERALVAICTDAPRKEQAAEAFLAIFKNSNDADREVLLSPLGRIGGPGALAVVDGLLADADPAKRALGLKALTRWPDATVAPRMLAMLGTSPDAATRDMLLGALIRIAPLPDNKLNDKQKLELVQKTMTLCQKDDDRARLLERANAIRTVETFRFVLPYVDNASLAEPACKSIVELAHHQKLRDGHREEFVKALDKVIVTTKNPELVERATRYKEGKTWARK